MVSVSDGLAVSVSVYVLLLIVDNRFPFMNNSFAFEIHNLWIKRKHSMQQINPIGHGNRFLLLDIFFLKAKKNMIGIYEVLN